jgi:hypothetical protein
MIEIGDRQQLFRKLLKKFSTGRSLASMAVSPAGKEAYGSGRTARQHPLSKTFSKFPTTYARLAPERESPRGGDMGGDSPAVNSLFRILSVKELRSSSRGG